MHVSPRADRRHSAQPPGEIGAPIQIQIPPIALPAEVHVHQPPHALIGPRNCDAVGLSSAEWSEHSGWMLRSPRWRPAVIEASRKRRYAAPDDIVASMRERYAAPSAPATATNDAAALDAALDAQLDRELGLVPAPQAPNRTSAPPARRRRGTRTPMEGRLHEKASARAEHQGPRQQRAA